MDEIAGKRSFLLSGRLKSAQPPFQNGPALRDAAQATANNAGFATVQMPGGAGHKPQKMSRICLEAMRFVRTKNERSSTPEEF